jgi:hypothetical protein
LITIAYSFRDEPVNISIFQNLTNPKKHNRLIIIGPQALEIKKNIVSLIPDIFADRVVPINGGFGDHHVFEMLREEIQPSRV